MAFLIGADEVGTGAWAGPFVVCAVAVPETWVPPKGLRDSKKLSWPRRLEVYAQLRASVPDEDIALFSVENTVIDRRGMGRMLVEAHTTSIARLLQRHPGVEAILDGVLVLPRLPNVRSVPRADATVPAAMAASVIAKVNRDLLMRQHHKAFPQYCWFDNVGYGTPGHIAGLRQHGPCPLHRRSVRSIKDFMRAVTK